MVQPPRVSLISIGTFLSYRKKIFVTTYFSKFLSKGEKYRQYLKDTNSHFRLPKALQKTGYKHFFGTALTAIQKDGESITPHEGKQFVSQEWTTDILSTPVEVKYGRGKSPSTMLVYPALKVESICQMLHVNHAIAQVLIIEIFQMKLCPLAKTCVKQRDFRISFF